MPRNYRKKCVTKYSASQLKRALNDVNRHKKTIYCAYKKYGIPQTTLKRWIQTTPKRVGAGRPTVLHTKEEVLIVCALNFTADCGFPLGREEVYKKYGPIFY